MKKFYSESRWKQLSRKRANKVLLRKRKNRKFGDPQSVVRKRRSLLLAPIDPDYFLEMVAPSNFSFINNPNELLEYLRKGRENIAKRQQIFLNKSEVTELTSDAIALLIATLRDKRFHRYMPFKGNAPNSPTLRQIFIESGFYDYVQSNVPKKSHQNYLIFNFSRKKVITKIAKEAALIGIKNTFGNENIFEPLYEILIECMSNTNNHAGRGKKALFNWWLYVYIDPTTKISYYSFIDLGVGIFDSIPVKKYVDTLLKKVKVPLNLFLVGKLLAGEISSRTGDPLRGKGLPQMYENSKHKNIKNFKLISNDIYADFDTGFNRELAEPFEGTFLYWELHP